MENWYKVASYFAQRLKALKGVDRIDLVTLNKIMYFAQRESYIQNDEPLFEENRFCAAPFGPVIQELKTRLNTGNLSELPSEEWINANTGVLDSVMARYGKMTPYSLSTLSHNEISWRNAREKSDSGRKYERILDSHIRIDALKVRLREEKLEVV